MLFYQLYYWELMVRKMTFNLMFLIILFSFFVIGFILFFIKKGKIKIKYAILWILMFGLLLLLLIFPDLLGWITVKLGFEVPSNMIFSFLLGILVLINISLTGIVSSQDKKIRILIQEISLLKKEKK